MAKKSPRASSRRWVASISKAPIVIRLDGTNAEEGRQILLDAGIRKTSSARSRPCSTLPRSCRARKLRILTWQFLLTRTPRSSSRASPVVRASTTASATATTAPRSSGASRPARVARTSRAFRSSIGRRSRRGNRSERVVRRRPAEVRVGRHHGSRRSRHRIRRVHHRGHSGPGRGQGLQPPARDFPNPAARPELPRHHQPRQVQHRHHRR